MPFYNESNDRTTFSIGFTRDPHQDFAVFAQGYTNAANALAHVLCERGNFPDYDAYPIVFLYRHALELYLKNIIYLTARLAAFREMSGLDMRLYNSHNLDELCRKATELLRILFPRDQGLKTFVTELDVVCREFSTIDSSSYCYRYPIDTKGNRATAAGQNVSLQSMYKKMASILEDLDSIDFGLDVATNTAQEIYEALRM